MRMPEAEVDIHVDLVRRLIEDQHPDLTGPLSIIANGWDNVIFRLGDDLTVRLPRRELAVSLIENEQQWLPELAAQLPVPIPVPIRRGRPTADFGWPWTIGPWFAGTPAADLPVADRMVIAEPLAALFAALHTPAPEAAPRNPVRGIPLAERADLVEQHLAGGGVPDVERVAGVWHQLLRVPAWDGGPRWVHGDPHPANFLVRDGRLAAVIDFGDLTGGDPATDLATAWLTFDDRGRRIFRDHYTAITGIDENTWQRARGWALSLGVSLLVNSDDNPRLAAIGSHALQSALDNED